MGAINFRQMKEAVSLPFNTVYSKREYDTTVVILLFHLPNQGSAIQVDNIML